MIHSTAIVSPEAELDSTVHVGPYSVIEAGVKIGAGTKIAPHVHIQGITTIGRDNYIGTGTTIGLPPQHTGYKGEPRETRIGDRNQIREYVSIQRAWQEGAATIIGNDCMLMVFTHVAHDCVVGNSVVMSNHAILAGHVTVGDRVFMSGHSGVHQFCRVGRMCFLGAFGKITYDVPPFMMVEGDPPAIRALNMRGLKRAGLSEDTIRGLRNCFRQLYRSGKPVRTAIEEMEREGLPAEVQEVLDFYADSQRGVLAGAR